MQTFASLMAAELSTRGLMLVSQLIVVRVLSPSSFGAYIYALSAALLIGLVVEFGLTALVTRDTSAEPSRAGHLLTAFLGAQAILGFAAVGLALAIVLIGNLTGPASNLDMVVALSAVGLNALSRPFEATLVGVAQSHRVTVSRTVRGLALLAGTVVAWRVDATPAGFLGAVAVSEAVGTLAIAVLARRGGVAPVRAVGRGDVVRLLRLALPFALVTALNLLYLRIDVLMIGLMKTSDDVGNYGAAGRILETAVIVPAFFGTAMLATISELGPRTPSGRAQIGQALRIIVFACTPLTIGLAIAAKPVIDLVIGGQYDTADDVLIRLSPMLLLIASYGVLMSVQVAADRVILLAGINLAGLVAKVGLNLYAIPRHGILGAAVAAVVAEALVVVLQWYTAREFVDVRPVLVAFARTFIAGAAMLICALLIAPTSWVLALAVGSIVYVLVAFATRAVSRGEVQVVLGAMRRAAPEGGA